MTRHLQKIGNSKGLVLTRDMLDHLGVTDDVNVSIERGRIIITAPETDSRERVMALLHEWQQEYGLPDQPGGKEHISVADLMAKWNAEDALLTPEEIEAEQKLWEDIELNRQPLEI